MFSLEQPIRETSFLANKLKTPLKKLGIETVADLVFCFPIRYEDRSNIKTLNELSGAGEATVRVQIKKISSRRSFKSKLYLTEAIIGDGTGQGTVIWFNQPYLVKVLMPGSIVWLSGKYKSTAAGVSFASPTYELAHGEQVHTGRIVPVYGSLGRLPQKSFRRIVHEVLTGLQPQHEWLPASVTAENSLPAANKALKEIHFPTGWKTLREAGKRFKFEELYLLALRGELARAEIIKEEAPPIPLNIDALKSFISLLPFRLTEAQRRAAWDIVKNLACQNPMNRLLDGDVGSGKTAVAAIAAYAAAVAGGQSVIMAPTEILAKQHFLNLQKMFSGLDIGLGLMTQNSSTVSGSNEEDRDKLLKSLKKGETKILVGTHAVIFEKPKFKNLALSIIDEQHRFGVKQRKMLKSMRSDNKTPHLLSMTATPIPRSLALVFYGDLDISVINEMPPGRKPVQTVLVSKNQRQQVYDRIKKEIQNGYQAFVICPLIDPSDSLGVRSATAEYERLKKEVFPDTEIGLLHGKMKPKEKDRIMHNFKENKISLLVATSVIEVGVDVPNATAMIIEGPERFGLAQLHQFRGRIGRGNAPSTCFVFLENKNPLTYARLKAFAEVSDGFTLAERDLALRGPGEIFGTLQSGAGEMRIATFADIEIASLARKAARKLISADKELKTAPGVALKLKEIEQNIHLE